MPWVGLAVWVAAGCAAGPERVTVDLGRIPAASVSAEEHLAVGFNPEGLEATSASLPGVPSRVLQLGAAQARIDAAQRIVEASRREAYVQVLKQLREAYRAEAQQWASERFKELAPAMIAYYDAALARLAKAFVVYADRRGPKIARLAVLAGFPDPDPGSLAKPDPSSPGAVRSAVEAGRLRGEVVALDKAFSAEARQMLAEASNAAAADRVDVERRIEAALADADARAERTATEQMAAARRELDALLASRSEWTLKAEAGRSLEVPGTSKLPGIAAMPRTQEFREDLAGDLDLWLRSRGYVLARKGQRGRDVTKEFDAWRAGLRAGR